ncbi:MAG: TolC family protein [Pseudomonadota bacterium]
MPRGKRRAPTRRLRLLASCSLLALAACTSADQTAPGGGGALSSLEAPGQAVQGDLTLAGAVRRAIFESPEIGIADAQLDNARAAIDLARSERGPTVDLVGTTGVENTYSETQTSTGLNRSEVSLGIESTLFDFGATQSGVAQRQSLASSAEFVRLDTMETVALETVSAYLDYLQSVEFAAAAASNTRNHQRIADLVAENERGGNATLADVNRAATRLEAAKSSELDAENAREDAIVEFRRLTGLSPAQVRIPARLAPPPRRSNTAQRRAAIVQSPELKAIAEERDALERRLDQQEAGRKPRVFVRGQGNWRNDVGGETGSAGDVSALLGFNIRLYSAGARRAEEAQTRARIRELDETYRLVFRDLEQEAEEVDQTLATASENAAFVQERFVTARDGLSLFQEQFEAGQRTAFELLDAQRDFFQAETERINNRFERAANVYRELRLRGVLVSTLLGKGG